MKYYLYNPKSNNGIRPEFNENQKVIEVIGLDYKEFFDGLKSDDEVVLVGGDGTINWFANVMYDYDIKNNVYLLASGTGNDFLNDIEGKKDEEILINQYLKNLPMVSVNGKQKRFINGVGYGIDGYCCEVADKIRNKTPNKKISYTGIAIKGLLFFFKPCHAKITVDGEVFEYDNVWLAPPMKGRFYGGGMMVAPAQNRFNDTISVVIYHAKSKLKSLIKFPTIFEGKHVEMTNMVAVHTGKRIKVEYSRPCAAQIDGETVLNVSELEAWID